MLSRLIRKLVRPRSRFGVRPVWAATYAGAVVWVVVTVLGYHQAGYGYTYLISFGDDALQRRDWPAERNVAVFTHLQSPGYDGQYYAQLALDPWLEDEALLNATVDDLPYRARRILLSWSAHVIGMGHPQWVLNVFALQNLAGWLVMGGLLLRWFPPVDFDRALRWFGLMFATGMCFSLTSSLADGPSLVMLTLALYWWDQGHRWRATAVLAIGGLMKETNILGGAVAAPVNWRSGRDWMRAIGSGLLVMAPLVIWMLVVRARLTGSGEGAAASSGVGNFDLPLVAVIAKAGALWREWWHGPTAWRFLAISVAALISIVVQAGFLLGRWRWSEAAWRLTVPFAALAVVIGGANWDGHPGGVTRSLLPMLLGFNLLVPRGRSWLPVLILGNLTMFFGPLQFKAPPEAGYTVRVTTPAGAPARDRAAPGLTLEFPRPWYALESDAQDQWRWAGGSADVVVHNPFAVPLEVRITGRWAGRTRRSLRVKQGEQVLWEEEVGPENTPWRVSGVRLPPGESRLRFETDAAPGDGERSDRRQLAFRIFRLDVRGTLLEPEP